MAKRRPKSILQWMEVHPRFEASNRGQRSRLTIDVFGPVPLRGNDMSLFRDSNINQRMAEDWERIRSLEIQLTVVETIHIAHPTERTRSSIVR